MDKHIKKLQDSYLLDGKLFYVSQDFIGYDPLISKGLSFDKVRSGTKVKLDSFTICGSKFKAILTYFIDWGPLRGYKRVEILKRGKTIINWECGSRGYGSTYYKGECYYLSGKDAFLVERGYAMQDCTTDKIYSDLNGDDYYFFWFKNVVAPTKYKILASNSKVLKHDRIYSRKELEPLRQTIWSANVTLNNCPLRIRKIGVPNCWQTYQDARGREKFQRIDHEGFIELDEVEFKWL